MRTTHKLKTAGIGVLVAAGLIAPGNGWATLATPVSECRQQAIDQTGFVECLTLLHEQSEAALEAIEEKWRTALETDLTATEQNDLTATTLSERSAPSEGGSAAQSEEQPASRSKLIAIVSGQTLSDQPVAEGSVVVNVDDEKAAEDAVIGVELQVQNAELQMQRFAAMPAAYRQYRDLYCQWQAALSGPSDVTTNSRACMIFLNQERVLELRRLLAEKRASDVAGQSFRGYYVGTSSGGVFQSCNQRQDWWVTGSTDIVDSLQRRYDDTTSENLEMVYVELRGRAGQPASTGPGADFVASIDVGAVNLMRPILQQDCGSAKEIPDSGETENDDQFADDDELPNEDEDEAGAVAGSNADTVDNLGDAGFLYGYFSDWRSACAIDQLAVCKAQTYSDFSTGDPWIIAADRSSDDEWRIRLYPTTENHTTGRVMQVSVDDNNIITLNTADKIVEVANGIIVASGAGARGILDRLRNGRALSFEWTRPDQARARLSFSLTGITRALKYFDQADK